MATESYKIFLSSRMEEFQAERPRIKEALADFFYTFVYEEDAGAKDQSIRETYTEHLEASDLYIGLFGTGYGEYTIEEFEGARQRNIPCLIYEKKLEEGEVRDKKLSDFLESISNVEDPNGLSTYWFENSNDLIAGIKRDIARWIKSRDPKKASTKLDEETKYYCNRVDQSIDFISGDQNEKFNFFMVEGDKKQSHASLVKRFSLDKTASDDVKKTIFVNDRGTLARLKIFIQMELFAKFNIKPLPKDLSLNSLAENILHDGYEKVFVVFRIEEEALSSENVVEVMRWFSKEYCDVNELPAGAPNFYFFLNVRYSTSDSAGRENLKKQLDKFDDYFKIQELTDVNTTDLGIWLEEHEVADNETLKEAIIQKYFKESNYPMELAEIQISKLIDHFNTNDQELMALINKH